MGDTLRSTSPVAMPGGFAGRQPGQPPTLHGKPAPEPEPHPADCVDLVAAANVAPELVRERVLAHTRQGLSLSDGETPPEFAEVRQDEPAALFLGRLLSAQNQLAARRAGNWTGESVRDCLDRALRAGCEEALEMLEGPHGDRVAAPFVVEVLADYERRLASLGDHQHPDAT